MTPKDKAKELVEKFIEHTQEWDEIDGYVNDIYKAKQCALIAVDELIKQCWNYRDIDLERSHDYWQEVKQEIENL